MAKEKISLSDIDNERKAMLVLAQELQSTTDDETRDALMAEIKRCAEKIQSMAETLTQDVKGEAPQKIEQVDAVVEVVLTKEQRKKVFDAYGVEVPSIRIPDAAGVLTKNMNHISPDYIESCAMNQAKAFKEMVAEAEAEAAQNGE